MTTLEALARASNALLAQAIEHDRIELPKLAARDQEARELLHELAVTIRLLGKGA